MKEVATGRLRWAYLKMGTFRAKVYDYSFKIQQYQIKESALKHFVFEHQTLVM